MNESTQILGIYHIPVPTEQIKFNIYMYIVGTIENYFFSIGFLWYVLLTLQNN